MTSFALDLAPEPAPRLAAAVTVGHLVVACLPWLARCPAPVATLLTMASLAVLPAALSRVPGAHCPLRRLRCADGAWWAWLDDDSTPRAAAVGPGSRSYAGLVLLDLRVEGRRVGWLLPRQAVAPAAFRRLKARLRLAC